MKNKIKHVPIGIFVLLLFVLNQKIKSQSIAPFFAPSVSTNLIEVRLYPMENVSVGDVKVVTFGLPITRGSLPISNLNTVRVLKSNLTTAPEIAAFVNQLTPWRHTSNTSIDNQFVRVAQIQITHTISVAYPNYESVFVEYGVTNRQANVSTFQNPKIHWHQVSSGSFNISDNIQEPDVYAVLPKNYLSDGALKLSRMLPLDNGVPSTRENPANVDVATYAGYLKHDHAVHNFYFSIVNQDDALVTTPNQCPYKVDSEPWLYDRSTAMYNLYMRSANINVLREAVRNTQFYKSKLYNNTTTPANAVGVFQLKVPNSTSYIGNNGAMYSYNECLAYTYWLVGDADMLEPIKWVVNAHEANSPTNRWSPTSGSWTERFTAFKLLANTVAYEVTGMSLYKDSMQSQAQTFIWHQNGANGQIPSSKIDGGLYHYGSQHGDGTANVLVASSWMTALISEAMLRVYGLTENVSIANFIKRVGDFEKVALKSDANHIYSSTNLWYGDYMMRYDGVSDVRDGSEIEHSMEVSTTLAWGAYFSALTGNYDYSLYTAANNAYNSYDVGVNYWVRPGGPSSGLTAYRVSPWRKYNWEYTPSASFAWLMSSVGIMPTSMKNEKNNEINNYSLYPNPVDNSLIIERSSNNDARIFISNSLGNILQSQTITEYKEEINLSNLPDGVYYLNEIGSGHKTKFVKIKL